MLQGLATLSLLGICLIAAWTDWQSRRIPNALILFSLKLLGIIIIGELISSRSLENFLERLAAGMLFMFMHWILYCSGNMGAGDVKLALVIGLALGCSQLIVYLCYYGIVLALVSLFLILRYKKLRHKSIPLAPIMSGAYIPYLLH